ncbi:MAG: hypothetical protein ACR2PY_04075 [Salinispira sp.]
MRVDFILDHEPCSINVTAELSLFSILKESDPPPRNQPPRVPPFRSQPPFEECGNRCCGYCVVLFNDYMAPSCLLPAFKLMGGRVETASGLMKQDTFSHIQQGFEEAGYYPCKICRHSAIILCEYILRREGGAPRTSNLIGRLGPELCGCASRRRFIEGLQIAYTLRHHRSYRRNIHAEKTET